MAEERDRESPSGENGRAATQEPELEPRAERLVSALAEHFSNDGVSIADWRRVAAKAVASTSRDRFLRLKPEVAVAHVDGIAEHFASDGLTKRQYLQVALKRPALLHLKPETVIGNVSGVVQRFAKDGLTTQTYLRAAFRQPGMFTQDPQTIITNIEGLARHFESDGLTLHDCLDSALKQPTLFIQKPETLASNIEAVVQHFARDGLTAREYLRAAVKQPSLFYQKPQTLIDHINILAAMHEKKLLPIPPGKNALMEFIVKHPVLISLAGNNLHLREIAAHLGDDPTAPMFKTREYVEDIIRHALRHGDGTSEKVSHARRLLLNALKHEGYLKER